jgi:hypothetical protein
VHIVCVLNLTKVRFEHRVKRAELWAGTRRTSWTSFMKPHVPNSINSGSFLHETCGRGLRMMSCPRRGRLLSVPPTLAVKRAVQVLKLAAR